LLLLALFRRLPITYARAVVVAISASGMSGRRERRNVPI
jgi:hypothetical protein